MTEKEKAAPQNSTTLNRQSEYINMKQIPKVIRACEEILKSPQGITENEILFRCHLSSGRNYPTKLERELDIVLYRGKEPNPDGIGGHLRYRITSREDAEQVAQFINLKRSKYSLPPLDPAILNNVLALYPSDKQQTKSAN